MIWQWVLRNHTTYANNHFPPQVLSPVRSFRAKQALSHEIALGVLFAGRHLLHHVLVWERGYEQFVETAGNGCGVLAYVGHVEKWYFGRQMQLASVGAGGIGVASPALFAV
jgi:hypothetical protein